MNTTAEPTPSDTNATSCKTLVDTLVGLGSSWALHGLKIGKMAIMTSAETLGKTAETLETLAAALQKKAADMKGETPATTEAAEAKSDAPAAESPAA